MLFFGCSLLVACSSERHVAVVDKVQGQYTDVVELNQRYLHGDYGKPDPASFDRLMRYRADAYQALMQFRGEFDKTKPIPTASLENAKTKINTYRSYLNALGATSATKQNLLGF